MIVAMLRVKDESRWIREVLESLQPCCERLFVMDDHSRDATKEIAEACGAVVYPSPFQGIADEARDKDWLLSHLQRECPAGTWVLCIDGDEVLEPSGPDKIRQLVEGPHEAYTFRILYLWDRRDQVRVDGVYGRFRRPSMFRLKPRLSFRRTGAHANFHCSSVPAQQIGQCRQSEVALLHLGYLDRADRIRKFHWYVERDGANSVEDGYRHVVIGDLFPATSKFRWGGPLELQSLAA